MKTPQILVFDLGAPKELVEALKAQVQGAIGRSVVCHERIDGLEVQTALREKLDAVLLRVVPDLVIFIFANEHQQAGPDVLHGLQAGKRPVPLIAVPCSDSPDLINALLEQGASDYLLPPFRPGDVQPRIQRLLGFHRASTDPSALQQKCLGLQRFVGAALAFLEQIHRIPRLARCDSPVFITGETGTGKELCARSLHYLSARANNAFVPVNCGAIPTELIENELFGHAAGAYTSAQSTQLGLIHGAHRGTLFLDELDSLSPAAQVKLLRFIEQREYRPLGSAKPCKADVRILAAANCDAEEATRSGTLRKDLFYRLNVLRLRMPPLRERREDIGLLARHFLLKFRGTEGSALDFTPEALLKLAAHNWPGNVRELENIIERAVVLCTGSYIQAVDLELLDGTGPTAEAETFRAQKARLIWNFEQQYLQELLIRCEGNISRAARAADKNRRAFFELLRKHKIRAEHKCGRSHRLEEDNWVLSMDKNIHPGMGLRQNHSR